MRKTNRLVAWRHANGKWHYPIWQFEDGRIRPGIGGCLEHLNENPWGRMIFFLDPRQSLGGKRPLDLLVKGRIEDAVLVARRHQTHRG